MPLNVYECMCVYRLRVAENLIGMKAQMIISYLVVDFWPMLSTHGNIDGGSG